MKGFVGRLKDSSSVPRGSVPVGKHAKQPLHVLSKQKRNSKKILTGYFAKTFRQFSDNFYDIFDIIRHMTRLKLAENTVQSFEQIRNSKKNLTVILRKKKWKCSNNFPTFSDISQHTFLQRRNAWVHYWQWTNKEKKFRQLFTHVVQPCESNENKRRVDNFSHHFPTRYGPLGQVIVQTHIGGKTQTDTHSNTHTVQEN